MNTPILLKGPKISTLNILNFLKKSLKILIEYAPLKFQLILTLLKNILTSWRLSSLQSTFLSISPQISHRFKITPANWKNCHIYIVLRIFNIGIWISVIFLASIWDFLGFSYFFRRFWGFCLRFKALISAFTRLDSNLLMAKAPDQWIDGSMDKLLSSQKFK